MGPGRATTWTAARQRQADYRLTRPPCASTWPSDVAAQAGAAGQRRRRRRALSIENVPVRLHDTILATPKPTSSDRRPHDSLVGVPRRHLVRRGRDTGRDAGPRHGDRLTRRAPCEYDLTAELDDCPDRGAGKRRTANRTFASKRHGWLTRHAHRESGPTRSPAAATISCPRCGYDMEGGDGTDPVRGSEDS
jgi:hypothetical protein